MEKLNKVYIKDPESGRSGYFDLSLTNFDERYLNLSSLDAQKVNSDIVLGKGKSLSAESDHEHNHSLIKHTTGSGDIVTLDQVQVGDNIAGKIITLDPSYTNFPVESASRRYIFQDTSYLTIDIGNFNAYSSIFYEDKDRNRTYLCQAGSYLVPTFTLPSTIGTIEAIESEDPSGLISSWASTITVAVDSVDYIEVGNTFDHLILNSSERPIVTTKSGTRSLAYTSDTKTSFGIKFSVIGLNQSIPVNTALNLFSFLNLTDKVVFADVMGTNRYKLISSGTANAALRLPTIDAYTRYGISVRLAGTMGGPGTQGRQFNIELQRANNTLVDSDVIAIPSNNDLGRFHVNYETVSRGLSDPYVTDGIKIAINNPSTGSATITLTGFEMLINGSY